ncbi:MAG: hypothetical protein RLZZ417_2004 [Bacteroidota bacterium]
MIKAIIIGRSDKEIENLIYLIQKHFPQQIEIAGTSRTLRRGMLMVKKEFPDVVFLETFQRKPFKFLESFKKPYSFEIIVISKNENNAMEAIKMGVFDYILYPVGLKMLKESIARLEEKLEEHKKLKQRKEIVIPFQNGYITERLENIIYLAGELNYSRIYLDNGRDLLIARTLKDFEEILDESFYRIHKSYLVNMSYIKEFNMDAGNFILLKNGEKLTVSHRRKDKFAKEFLEIKQGRV